MSDRREFLKAMSGGVAAGFPLASSSFAWGQPGKAGSVNQISLVLPPRSGAVVENIARVFTRQVSQRCDATVASAGHSPLRVSLVIQAGLGAEGFEIVPEGKRGVRITGNDERGLLYGLGKVLRSSRYDRGGFTPGNWRGTSAPQAPFRGIDAATHFMNFYEAAPLPEVQRYIEDLGLWGANVVMVGFPFWHFRGFDDPAGRRTLEQMRGILKAGKAIGLQVGLQQCPTAGFSTAPKEIRVTAVPDDLGRRGHFGDNCCPSNPAGHKYLLGLYAWLFDNFKDIGVDYLELWPYDEGGCGCAQCWPWGARGFPKLARDVVQAGRARFPALKSILSTWCYDTPPAGEWEGLAKFLQTEGGWLDYIMADSHTDFPRYPLERGVPGGLPLLNFPEISMWGRAPWGGFGANPLPARFERLWKQTENKLAGGLPYSEGIYADINQVICLQFYWQKSRSAADIVREYLAFEYSPDMVEPLWEAVGLLERTWITRGPDCARAFAILQQVDAKLTPQAKAAWRWRILYLRGLIDAELYRRNGKMEGPELKKAFDELTRIYHGEHVHSMPVRPPQLS